MNNNENRELTQDEIEIQSLLNDIFSNIKIIFATSLSYMSIALDNLKIYPYIDEEIQAFILSGKDPRFGTDGEILLYYPPYIINNFQNMPRNILHSLLHCVLHHIFTEYSKYDEKDVYLWNISMDICVENIIEEIISGNKDCEKFKCGIASIKRAMIADIGLVFDSLTPDSVFEALKFLTDEELINYEEIFKVDDHLVWNFSSEGKGRSVNNNNGDGEKQDEQSQDQSLDDYNERQRQKNKNITKDKWKTLSEMIKQDMKNSMNNQHIGDSTSSLSKNLGNLNSEKYSYEEFLQLFGIENEALKINEDEFDLGYYSYGLELYSDMPFIEPLEYQDIKQIKDFVIAIDTSGSINIDLARKFLTKTYNILKTKESFSDKVNIHIVQCDYIIQDVVHIKSLEDIDEYIQNFEVKGLGGTSFIPVFNYVDELITSGDFNNLKGMVYFTDTFGEFPTNAPDYETVIIYSKSDLGYYKPNIPNWAIGFDLDKTDLN
ncbi:MAG: VWA-like domain-containing protein [bacterium]